MLDVSCAHRTEHARAWIIHLSSAPEHLPVARALLSEDELARCQRIVGSRQRQRLLLARAAVRVILGEQLGTPPARVPIIRTATGRPRLPGIGAPSFSVSHTGDWAAVAFSSRGQVGVDIERSDRRICDRVIRRLMTPRYADTVLKLGPEERMRTFLEHWTSREACTKAMDGAAVPAHAHELSVLALRCPSTLVGMLSLRAPR